MLPPNVLPERLKAKLYRLKLKNSWDNFGGGLWVIKINDPSRKDVGCVGSLVGGTRLKNPAAKSHQYGRGDMSELHNIALFKKSAPSAGRSLVIVAIVV